MLHTFVAYVEDLPGVLTRVASLFRRLNININSLTVGRSERQGLSRLTLVCEASAEAGHRIQASLFKLENVVDVDDIAEAPSVTRELALIKVAATPQNRSQIFELVEVFRQLAQSQRELRKMLESARSPLQESVSHSGQEIEGSCE